jgi:mRNA-degrading endonuclease RelE of RelBE toxin-antitoxin system
MRYEIVYAPSALEDIRGLPKAHHSAIRDGVERYLRHEPMKESKSRIKRMPALRQPQYRLRLDEYRVYYDVRLGAVEVLGVSPKWRQDEWLGEYGIREEGS